MTFQDPAGERERRELRRTLSVIRGSNPDHEARVRTRAQQTGVSATALRILPEDQWPAAETSAARADQLLVTAPRTALSLSDEGFARVASDDVETLVGIERTVSANRAYYDAKNNGASIAPISRPNTPGQWLRGVWTSFTETGSTIKSSLEMQTGDFLEGLGLIEQSRVNGRTRAESNFEGSRLRRDLARPDLQGNLQQGLYSGLESAVTMVPALAASVLLRNPAPALAVAGLQTETEAYGRYRGRGASAGEAFLGAGGEAAVEVLTELLPMGALVRALGGGRIARNLAVSLGSDILGEQAATLAQDAIDTAIANPDKTWGDYFAERPDAAVQTLVASLVQQAIFSAPGAVVTVLQRDEQDREALKKSEQGVQTVENLIALSEASKLRERSPEDFADFVRQATADGPLESVYIKADVFAQSAAAAGVSVDDLLQTMPYLREQMPTALATNGDLKIDTADFAAYIAPQTFAQSLLPHLKADAAGFSRSEAEAFVAQQGERLRQDVEAAVQAGQVNEQAMRSMDVVREQVLAELQKAGRFTRDVNTGYADLVANFYAATAARMGITAEELAERFPLRVRGELPQSGQRAVLDQEAELDLFHMSGAAGLTRTDPSRWGQNRSATSREEATRAGMGAPGRTYFGIRGGYQPERVIRMTSPFEYSARVPASRVYDYDADPQNLRPEGPLTPEAASAYESAIQAAGFLGYRTEKLGGVAALFEPVDVQQTGPVRTAAEANALNARMRELAQADRLARLEARPAGSTTPVTARDPETFREQALAELFGSSYAQGPLPDEHPDRISTRLPTTKGAKEDPIADKLVVSTEAMGKKPSVLEHNTKLVSKYPGVRTKARSAQGRARAFIDHVKANLLALFDRVPAETRERSKQWYDGARTLTTVWAGRYGLPDRSVAAVLAALSPQKDWYQNVSLAERVLDVWSKRQDYVYDEAMEAKGAELFAKYPDLLAKLRGKSLAELEHLTEKAAFVRIYDQAHNPRGFRIASPEGQFLGEPSGNVAWGSLVEIAKAVSVLEGQSFENISSSLGDRHKVRNFYNNIISPRSAEGDVTIDTHAVAAGLLRALSGSDAEVFHNFGSSPLKGKQPDGWVAAKNANEFGVSGTYGLYADAYREAAAERGVSAREMQSITWEAVRGLFGAKFKANKKNVKAINDLWLAHGKGDASLEETINAVIEYAGGIAEPSWNGPGSGLAVAERQASYDGELSRAGLPGRGGADGGTDGGTAGGDPAARVFNQGPVEAPLEGQPQTANIPGRGRTVFGPHAPARQAARDYMAAQGLRYEPPTAYAPVDTARAERIAQAFEEMKHDPADPLVAAAYRAMIDETLAQWQTIKATGLKVEFITGADPYAATPRLAILDVVENNHLWVFPTDDGFGSSDMDVSGNPLLEMTGEFIDGRELRANDVFRIVHDYFGHIKDGNGFRADGEENAWQSHAAMYTPLARRAMTTETRGQNSWVNFGPKAEFNRTASAADTVYADQKIGLLPEWVSSEGFLGGAQTGLADGTVDQTKTPEFKAWFGNSVVKDAAGEPLVVYHGTPFGPIEAFDESELVGPEGVSGFFFSADPEVARAFETPVRGTAPAPVTLPVYLSIKNPARIDGDVLDDMTIGEFFERVGLTRADVPLVLRDRIDEDSRMWLIYKHEPEVFQTLRAKGFDGFTAREKGAEVWVAFEPNQIKSVFNRGTFDPGDARILYQSQPTFYSALTRAVELSPLTKAPAAQWLATIRKTAGVKAEEIEWTGLEAWLELLAGSDVPAQYQSYVDAKGNVLREDVATFLRLGGVQVEEVVLGDRNSAQVEIELDDETDQWVVRLEDGDEYGRYSTYDRAEYAARGPDLFQPNSRFSSYKLPGADDTYRELLFRLPKIDGPSTHWDEDNVVAHVRFTERKDAEGARVLFLEELQSDWHQKGRDEGYKQEGSAEKGEQLRREAATALTTSYNINDELLQVVSTALPQLEEATLSRQEQADVKLLDDRVSASVKWGAAKRLAMASGLWPEDTQSIFNDLISRAENAQLRAREASIASDAANRGGGIPDAPFRTSWSTMVMKRMIRWAVDNGYDKVAWINGNQQNGGQTGGDGSFFYERNLINDTNKLLKSYGAKVEKIDFRSEKNRELDASRQRWLDDVPGARPLPMTEAQIASGVESRRAVMAANARPTRKLGIQNGFVLNDKLREAALQGFSLFQENRGQIAFGADISQTPTVISLLKTADLSTFLHETGHFFLEVTAHIARQPDAPAGIVEDMAAILSWFRPGMTLAEWDALPLEQKRPFHETFARGFEAYLFEGRSPSPSLRDLFRRFSAWLKNVYRSLTALDVELTDEVRSVFDRMVASADDIATTEQARAFAPLFSSMPEGMTKFEWEEYQRLGTEATQAAVEGLEQRSLRDMQWASGARSRALKGLQRQANEQRKTVRAEVTAEVMAEPVNRARQFLRRGIGDDGEPISNARKLDLATLKSLYGEDGAWTKLRRGGKYGEVATDGMHPDAVAELFGFPSGEALIDALVNGEPTQAKIDGITDQRMLERYGDLSSVEAIERAADEAVANDARAKFIAAEMSALDKAVGKRSILNEAARDYAAGVVNRTIMNRLRPAQYIAAQTRAAKEAEAALRKDDLVAAATAKRNQLINLHVARQVQAAQKDAEKTMRLFKRIIDAKDAAVSRTRNMDMVNAARAVLAAYGLGRVKNDPAAYMEALKRYDPTLYADLEPFVQGARGQAKPLHEITYEQFQGLRDTVNQLWALSRRSRQIEIDGQLLDRKMVVGELNARMLELGLKAGEAGFTRAPTENELFKRQLAGVRAALRRVESWARGVDGGDQGPFRRFIWNPISTAADAYRAEARTYILRFRDLVKTVEDRLKPVKIAAPELGHTFGNRAELYHALLHTGNQSNKSKLLLGRRWGDRTSEGLVDDTRWAAFLDRMHAEGVLEQRDWDFVQAVWDLLEETKPGAQRAHREIYGRYFSEIVADPVETPFGTYRGGYVPAITDPYTVQDAVLRAEQNALEDRDSAMFPSASNGFTKSRVEDYTRSLALDLRLLPSHIDKVLLFTHLGPPVRDVARLLRDRSLSETMHAFDPVAQTDLLLPWLQRAARQTVETPTSGWGGKWVDKAARAIRSRTGMQLMFANVLNTLQQLTGFSGVFLRVKPSYVGAALWRFMRDPAGTTKAVAELSVFMANRQQSDMYEARQIIEQLVKLDPSKVDEARMFLQRHAYFLQTALQNVMDAIAWPAAYDKALARGDTPAEAVRFADSVIRETQGTTSPEDISRFETGPSFVRVFTQFAGYFNMMANLNATETQIVSRSIGVRKGAGRLLYITLMTLTVPALFGEAIAAAMRGSWEDEEEDGYLDEMLEFFFLSQAKFALAAVPGVGQLANAAIGAATKEPYDDRISVSPAVSTLEAAVGVPAAVYQTVVEGEKWGRKETRDVFTLLGMVSGTPLGAVGRPAGYAVGVAQGEIEPTSPLDAARGMVTGVPSAESRQ